jgi:hypothetical protein
MRDERRLWVFENRVLRRVFGFKRDELTRKWRKIHNEEFNVQHCSPNIVRLIKLRRMSWAGHVACMGERRGFWWGNLKLSDHLRDPGGKMGG